MSYFKQHELGSNKATQIETFCAERNITTLTHFTRIENLSSILQSGLLSRRQLDSQEGNFYFNDSDRYDEQKDAICLSLSFPNYKMFYSIRETRKKIAGVDHSQWVVLLLDVEVLWELDCAFCRENASSNRVRRIPLEDRKGPDALRSLFQEEFYDDTKVIWRQSLAIPAHYPTNPQAEILVFDKIPSKHINTIVFLDRFTLRQWNSDNPATYTQEFCTDTDYYYFYRQDYEFWKGDSSDSDDNALPENIPVDDDIPF